MRREIQQLCVMPRATLRECLNVIERTGQGIALVVGGERRLLGTITDGDVRRAILAGVDLGSSVKELLEQRNEGTPGTRPLTARAGATDAQLIHMMTESGVRHVPLVDESGRVVDVALLGDLVKEYELPLRAVVMAGGYGERLHPLTESVPKPMLHVGSRPLLELIVEQLKLAGIRQVHLATHYKGEQIAEHFRDGRDFGIDIRYVKEDEPLGTAGALGFLEQTDDPVLVMNGDILTRIDFRSMLDLHREHRAELTMAVRPCEFRVPYGVVETDGVAVRALAEKPVARYLVNAGIYLLEPSVCRMVPRGRPHDIPDLINKLLDEKRTVISFPLHGYWLDIGQTEHYEQAQADVAAGRF
jgi:dTDP-glucose pyrophosphorylase/CBS domain-containing protein